MEKTFPRRLVTPTIVLCGAVVGVFLYLLYISRAASYLSDDPSACVNCHIMAPYYQSWQKSSHQPWTTCNDCHVPQDNIIKGYSFKAKDGLYHASIFTLRMEPQVIRPRAESYGAIMDNCIRCHSQLNTEFVNTGMISFDEAREGKGKACWDCHSTVAHGKQSSIASTPNAIVTPLPESPVPKWLKKAMEN